MFRCVVILAAISLAFSAVTKKDRVVEQKPLSDETPGSPEYDHEAFLGEEESKTFDQLTPEESRERLGLLVDKIDANKNGQVDEDELKKWIRYTQHRYVDEDASRQFVTGERTKSDKMEMEEYMNMMYGHLEDQEDAESSFSYAKMKKRDEKRWKKADQDGDGKHSYEEFRAFLHPEEFPHMKEVVLDETIEDIDKNGDGLINLEEYIGDMYTPEDGNEEPEWVKTEREQFSQHRDENNDGALDREEVKKWILPDDYDHVEAEAKHLIYESDDDKDDVLSKQEILDHYETFVGSQVTNWGDDLTRRHDEF